MIIYHNYNNITKIIKKQTFVLFACEISTLNWQGHIRSGQGCLSVLLCCFLLRVRPVHVLQAPCRAPKRPLSDSSASSRFDFGIFKEAEWGVLNVHPLTMTQKMPKSDRWRRVSPCQFRVNIVIINGSRNRRGFVKKPSPFFYKQKLTLSGV